jgi:hypothetical protein
MLGLEDVRTQWALVRTADNLKKLCKVWKKGLAAWTLRTPPTALTTTLGASLMLYCGLLSFGL